MDRKVSILMIGLVLGLFLFLGCTTPSICGDTICSESETTANCPADCGVPAAEQVILAFVDELGNPIPNLSITLEHYSNLHVEFDVGQWSGPFGGSEQKSVWINTSQSLNYVSDSKGQVLLVRPAAGDYTVMAWDNTNAYEPAYDKFTITPETEVYKITLKETPAWLDVLAIDGSSEEKLLGPGKISIMKAGDSSGSGIEFAEGETMSAYFQVDKGSEYTVYVFKEGYSSYTDNVFISEPYAQLTAKLIPEPKVSTVTVQVVDENGGPVAEAEVTLNETAFTDASGKVIFANVPYGVYGLHVRHFIQGAAPAAIEVDSPQESLTIETSLGFWVIFEVYDALTNDLISIDKNIWFDWSVSDPPGSTSYYMYSNPIERYEYASLYDEKTASKVFEISVRANDYLPTKTKTFMLVPGENRWQFYLDKNTSVSLQGLVALYHLDESKGPTYLDSSDSNNNAITVGTNSPTPVLGILGTNAQKFNYQCLKLDAIANNIGKKVTYSAWVKFVKDWAYAIDDQNSRCGLTTGANGIFTCCGVSSGVKVSDSVMRHYVCQSDGTHVWAYINGVKVIDQNSVHNNIGGAIRMGSRYSSCNEYTMAGGVIEEFGVWRRIISADEVLALYNAGK